MCSQLITESQAEQIHLASLSLLENPGVMLEHDAICAAMLKAGAKQGDKPQQLRLPREFVMGQLAKAPRQVSLVGRGKYASAAAIPCGKTQVWSTPGLNLFRHSQHRPFTSTNMAEMARLVEQLPEVDGVFGVAMDDVTPKARDVVGLRVMAENTSKHIRVLCHTPEGADMLTEMRKVIPGSNWFSIGFTAHGPLRWTNLALEIYRRTAGHGIPASLNGEPMAGVSGPVTLAGSAAVGNAEILAGIAVNQVLEPGRPCIYNLGCAHAFDMRATIVVTGGPENHLFAAISAAMGRFYNLPSCSWVSTEAMEPDSQAALEKSMGFLTHQQNGIALIWGAGQLESELTISFAQAVIDNEMLAYTRRYLRGVEFNDATLAVEATREVGIGGDFLSSEHTAEHFRDELFEPALLLRSRRALWNEKGSPSLAAAAEAKADALIAKELPPALEETQSVELRKLEKRFLSKLG